MNRKILTVVGARPQFIKAAPISRALSAQDCLHELMVHTGQHFETSMSEIFFRELGIPIPAYNLDINGGSHGEMTGRMVEALEKIMLREKPNMVLIYGDTTSTLAAALAASKLLIPLAHIEAGLRSYNRSMPEEINRVLSDHVSDLLFCPTNSAIENLAQEGIRKGVHKVGDVMYDAALLAVEKTNNRPNIIDKMGLIKSKYALATVHREENTSSSENLNEVINWIKQKAQKIPVVFPLHPRTRIAASQFGLDFDGIIVCEPVSFLDMSQLLSGAAEVYTDSGGLQKEAYFYRKRCVTLRDETEWLETIECGWNRLWKEPKFRTRKEISEYGDGRTSGVIIEHILKFFNSFE